MQTGKVKNIKPSKKSIWINRKGQSDLFGTADNADPSIKDADGCLTLNVGDTVHFDEGIDPQGRATALHISLSTIGNNMAKQQNNNNNQNQNQKQSAVSRVYVDYPLDGQVLTESATKGKYNVKVRAGQTTEDPQFKIPTRFYLVNGDERWWVKNVEIETPQNVTLDEQKLDLTQPVYVEVEKAGYANSKEGKDQIEIPTKSVKKGASAASLLKRIDSKFVSFANSASPNFIQVFKKDGDGKPTAGKIQVILGQPGKVNSATVTTGFVDVDIPDSGMETLAITLDERDFVVIITDEESGQTTKEFLKKF